MAVPVRILVVEDPESGTGLLLEELRYGRLAPEWTRVQSAAEIEAALQRQEWDAVVSDGSLPGLGVPAILQLLRRNGRPLPLLLVTGSADDETVRRAMQAGAEACIGRDDLSGVVRALERIVRKREARRPRPRAETTPHPPLADAEPEDAGAMPPEPAAEEAGPRPGHVDPLTGLPNRDLFDDRLEQALTSAHRTGANVAVMFLDLDHFKAVNDGFGHSAGDELLRAVARRLVTGLRAGDTVSRRGGDEFTLLLGNVGGAEDAARIARKVLDALRPPFRCAGHPIQVTGSIGVSLYPSDGVDAETLLKRADTALYRAKEAGRDEYRLYSPAMHARAFERLVLETSLRGALERQELVLHYQPQVELATGRISGFEALVRWQHSELGLLPPARFVALADETGLAAWLGEWVLRTACQQARDWQRQHRWRGRLSVNLSMKHLLEPDFSLTVAHILRETGLPAGRLEVELGEAHLLQHEEAVTTALQRLRNLGVGVTIDDFGTAWMPLAVLRRLPVDRVKLDGTFVAGLAADAAGIRILRSLVGLAHALGLTVAAEGVETERQLAVLISAGCDAIQGHLVSHALAAPEAAALVGPGGGTAPGLALWGLGPRAWARHAWELACAALGRDPLDRPGR